MSKIQTRVILMALIIGGVISIVFGQVPKLPKKDQTLQRIYGLTLEYLDIINNDNSALDTLLIKIRSFEQKPTVRVVFQRDLSPAAYTNAIDKLKNDAYLMGMILDSEALRDYRSIPAQGTCEENEARKIKSYPQRVRCYVNAFKNDVAMWEVGNEINGEWADENYHKDLPHNPDATILKIRQTLDIIRELSNDTPTALTFSYQPKCGEWADNRLLDWAARIPAETRSRIDYVLISYYEDKCNFKTVDGNEMDSCVFKPLRRRLNPDQTVKDELFPAQFFGIGEIGYSVDKDENGKVKKKSSHTCADDPLYYCNGEKRFCLVRDNNVSDCDRTEDLEGVGRKQRDCRKSKIDLIDRYYGLTTTDSKYIMGGFWWNAQDDIINDTFKLSLASHFRRM